MGHFGNSEVTNTGDQSRENGNRRQSDPVYFKNEGLHVYKICILLIMNS